MRPDAARPRAHRVRAPRLRVALGLLLGLPLPLAAQRTTDARDPQFELRADALLARFTTAQLGVGANVPLGNYVRLGVTGAAGNTFAAGGSYTAGRADVIARFLLDPYREHRWGPYAGAGTSALYGEGGDWQGAIVAVIGVEGPAAGARRTALEIGLGGGTRIGVVLRWGRRDRR